MESFGQRIDGHNPAGMQWLTCQGFPVWRAKDQPPSELAHLATHCHTQALCEVPCQIGLVEPGALDQASLVRERGAKDALAARAPKPRRAYRPGHRDLVTKCQFSDLFVVAQVLIAAGQVVEQVAYGQNPQRGHPLRAGSSHTTERGDRIAQCDTGALSGPVAGLSGCRFSMSVRRTCGCLALLDGGRVRPAGCCGPGARRRVCQESKRSLDCLLAFGVRHGAIPIQRRKRLVKAGHPRGLLSLALDCAPVVEQSGQPAHHGVVLVTLALLK